MKPRIVPDTATSGEDRKDGHVGHHTKHRQFWTPTLAVLSALSAQYRQVALHTALLVLGLLVQGVLILTVAHLIDLAVSLMELWAELARKHLEITLSP